MIRKTLTIFSLIGLLLSVGLWGVSYLSVEYISSQQFPDFGVVNGLLIIGKAKTLQLATGVYYGNKQFSRTLWWPPEGFPFWSSDPTFGWCILLPLWMPMLLFASAIMSCSLAGRLRCRKRKKLGLCLKCGYDLRGSKERCPECGNELETT